MNIKSDDRHAFEVVYDAYAEKVYQTALYYSKRHHVAEDITQNVFMTLYLHRKNINWDKIGTWLNTTAKYMAINYVRDHAREIITDSVDEMVVSIAETPLYMESLEEFYMCKLKREVRIELTEEIFSELYRKSQRWYEAVTITYILERPQKEVAETMGLSLGALQVMLIRAKKWIRKHYQEQFDHLDDE